MKLYRDAKSNANSPPLDVPCTYISLARVNGFFLSQENTFSKYSRGISSSFLGNPFSLKYPTVKTLKPLDANVPDKSERPLRSPSDPPNTTIVLLFEFSE
ncbi:hypothetical protein D3C74_279190 [compost metagenome]